MLEDLAGVLARQVGDDQDLPRTPRLGQVLGERGPHPADPLGDRRDAVDSRERGEQGRTVAANGTGVAVRKGNAALRDALDFALSRLAARGVLADLYLKYFPVGPY